MKNVLRNFKSKGQDKSIFFNMSTRNKLFVFGTLVSSILIVGTAWFVIDNTQKRILDGYHNYASMLAKTLSVQGFDIVDSVGEQRKFNRIKTRVNLVIKNNKDISYIVYTDLNNKVVYSSFSNGDNELLQGSSINDMPESVAKVVQISHPIISPYTNKTVGSVQLGLTSDTLNSIGENTRNLLVVIFTVAWLLSIAAVVANTLLITRQIKILVEGVKRVSTGEFGYKLPSTDLWGEIKQLFDAFNEMSCRLRLYEDKNIDQLTYERNKMEAVLMSIANGVVVCDSYDNIVLVNNSGLKLLEVSPSEIINSKIMDYYDLNGELCFKEKIKKFKDTPMDEELESGPFQFQININGRIAKVIISPIFTSSEEYLGYILVMHDVTKEIEVDKMKNNFISNVSHELRTPVTVLRSYIDTLYNYGHEFDDNIKAEFFSIMNQEADRLNKTVNDILDFSRLESPNVELEKTLSDIGPIIKLTITSMKVLAEDKNLSFSIIIEPNMPMVMINPESIERVLKNLLSNAIKYSNKGSRIKVRAEIDRTGHYLQLSIEDNGIGIPEEHLPKLFDRFYRVENKTHAIKGTGLGLHLVKITIEKHHGGHVFVQSELNVGSTFGFRIPLVTQEVCV